MIGPIALTLYGQGISGLSAALGDTTLWLLELLIPSTRLPLDLTGSSVVMSLQASDPANPYPDPVRTWSAGITSAMDGQCQILWESAETAALNPGNYWMTIEWIDPDGNRAQYLRTLVALTDVGVPVAQPGFGKGDILVFNGATFSVLPAGSEGQYLTPDPLSPTGLKWSNLP